MEVLLGKSGGFCFGVKRALENAYSLKDKGCYVLGELIHNESVIEKLKKSGLITVNSLDEVVDSVGKTLLIRTHGEPPQTFETAKNMGLNIIDCTCPFVKEIQTVVQKFSNLGYFIVIIGKAEHAEVKGIKGWCNGPSLITEDYREINAVEAEKLCIVVQTTYSNEKYEHLVKKIAPMHAKTVEIFKTICYTTIKRQKEAEHLALSCDAVIVLGGAGSNNTEKLFEVCKQHNEHAFRIVNPKDFDYEKIKNFIKVGIVLGASTPIEQFQEVISSMEKVTEVKTSETEEVLTEQTENKKEEVAVAPETAEVTASEQAEISVKEEVSAAPVEKQEESAEKVSAEEEQTEKPAKKPAKEKAYTMEAAFAKIESRDFRMGQIITAKISSAIDEGITVSINAKSDILLSKDEMLNEYNKADYSDKIDTDIRLMVIGKNPLKLSEKAMAKVLKEEAEVEEIRNGKIFEVTVDATNKGGLTAKYGSYQVFIPSSQIRIGFVKNLDEYVGKTLKLKAEKVESRGARRQIVGSQRIILQAEKDARDAERAEIEEKFFANVQVGDIVTGIPVRFAAFGAFVDVSGFDCLAHISDLSWTGCAQCSDVLELNKEYQFVVLKIDQETKRVSIGYKQLQARPWDTVFERYQIGDVVKGKVVRIVSFGAFVEIEKGIDGLVHVSQISNQWLENPVTALQVGQEIEAKILDINPEKEKMTLSIKALLPEIEKPEPVAEEEGKKSYKGKKKNSKNDDDEYGDLREWKEGDESGVSIAEIINKQ